MRRPSWWVDFWRRIEAGAVARRDEARAAVEQSRSGRERWRNEELLKRHELSVALASGQRTWKKGDPLPQEFAEAVEAELGPPPGCIVDWELVSQFQPVTASALAEAEQERRAAVG